ncbi:helix-turn-helix transcriptional regulator [Luteimonas sp. BDR2-5]|uniref:helix-turn-helix transcriptional regulator n=1 Tax=Proluteimonas luteida TaxID=2878685 RepID=UPI001E5C82DD|nr:helix-turn-helix transcriptional regulator [Luteimonas sp. BDR2-5]MCD9029143.1 helix-turn-helix transcriptional regulator [Luteimonas sp. BDR2-5]
MLSNSSVHRLRVAAHELHKAAIQPKPLERWAGSVASLLDADIADLTVFAPSGIAVENGSTNSVKPDESREYLDHYQFINPLMRFWENVPPGKVVPLDGCLADAALRETEFYSRYGRYLDGENSVCMLLGIRTAKVLVHACRDGHHSAAAIDKTLLEGLRDDLLLSFEIAGTFAQANNMVGNVIRSLDQKGVGVAILAEDGGIEACNGSMTDLLSEGVVLRTERGRLVPGGGVHLPDLQALVQRARKKGQGGSIPFGMPPSEGTASRRHRGNVIAFPAPVAFDWEGVEQNKVVLLVTDSSRPKTALMERLRADYGLTCSEARVVCMLLDGKTSLHIASDLNVQPNSVRAHLKAVYAKTGTHSQVELLNLIRFIGDAC